MANDAVGQRIQRDDIFQKANVLSFQGLTASFAILQSVFGSVRPFDHAKGPLAFTILYESTGKAFPLEALENRSSKTET